MPRAHRRCAAAIHERPRDELHAARQALTVVELQTSVERFFAHDSRRNSERQAEPLDFGMTKTVACSRIELKHAVLRRDLEHPRRMPLTTDWPRSVRSSSTILASVPAAGPSRSAALGMSQRCRGRMISWGGARSGSQRSPGPRGRLSQSRGAIASTG